MDRDNVSVGLNALGYERFLPRKVVNFTVNLTAVKPSREHQKVVFALESGLDHAWKVATLLAGFIDSAAYRL